MTEKTFPNLLRDFLGILALAFTLFAIISLVTYSPQDPSLNKEFSRSVKVENLGGLVGAYISDGLAQTFGSGAFFFPLVTLILGWALVRGKQFLAWPVTLGSGVLLLVSVCTMVGVQFLEDPFFTTAIKPGGMVGTFLSDFLVRWLNLVGATLFLVTMIFLSLLAMTGLSTNSLIDLKIKALKVGWQGVCRAAGYIVTSIKGQLPKIKTWIEAIKVQFQEKTRQPVVQEPVIVTPKISLEPQKSLLKPAQKKENKKEEKETFVVRDEFPVKGAKGDYKIPPLSLLNDPPPSEGHEQIREEILEKSKILEQKLADFGIQGRVVQVLPGPFITLFEFEPAPGIKVSRILSLSDDLALAMRTVSLRILAPVPGKPVVGIEIPNSKRKVVSFKEIVSSPAFSESESKLSIVVGKDNIGEPIVQDLATIPHLLIAGSTGSGKSVGLNSMICSILLNASPEEVKMIMIDPKMLELSMYDGIPHLIAPVVINPKKAAAALQWAVNEMETRYKIMAERGVRNISGFNALAERLQKEYDEELKKRESKKRAIKPSDEKEDDLEEDDLPEPPTKLPYVVVVIDELADLMMVASKGVEDALTRLAQMARAAGIHLIVATQRPSVDVLTGIIKANFPSRMSFKVTSRVDSRTILAAMGAEKLLGKGDMLFMPPGTNRLFRIHGAMLGDEEINRIINFIKQQKKPEYKEDIFQAVSVEETFEGGKEEEYDEKYDEAVALIAKDKQASISYVQRRLRIGYNRAARIIEMMEKEGLVGPSDGVKPREVFVQPISLDQ